MADLVAMQRHFLAPAFGTAAVIMSTIEGMKAMASLRYAKAGFKHPYMPWTKEHEDAKALRGFKANQNQIEWTTLTVPWIWLLGVYGPAVPVAGKYTDFAVLGLALTYAYANLKYAPAYIESAEAREPYFKLRTTAFKGLAFGSIGAMACSFAATLGYL
mmetsp:Transcript_6235/g.16078  ORF Transcript_6235/g.16078 Transcript_6235/m.16078 type:complete len:159 (-) Transcript_6235:81-557(-)